MGLAYEIQEPYTGDPSKYNQTCRNPNRSKWLIRHVASNTVTQPQAYREYRASRPIMLSTFQISPPIGCHFQNSKSKAALESNTYVLRSTALGTILVHAALNHGRAITLC